MNQDKEIEIDGVRMSVEDARAHRRVYQHLKDQGESEAAELVKSLSIDVGVMRARLHHVSAEVVELYKQNGLLGEALARKTLDDNKRSGREFNKFLQNLFADLKQRADAEPAPDSPAPAPAPAPIA